MKIIHITIGKANPERMNGVNKAVHNIASQMIKNRQDVEVWGLTKTPNEITTKRDYPLHLFESGARSLMANPLVIEAIDALPPTSVIHFHGGFVPAFYPIARHLKKKNIAWIISPHGSYMKESIRRNQLLKKLYFLTHERFLLKHAQGVHALTDLEEREISSLGPKVPPVTVPNGFTQEADAKKSTADIFAHAKPVFCFMGRMDKIHKGLDLFFDGFAAYRQSGGQGEIWMIGDGPHMDYLRRYADRLNIIQHIRFWGPRYGAEKINILRNAHVFVHTSRWEGMPTAILEAASCGKPLLISKETGMASAVDKWKCGFVLEYNDAESIAKAMFQCQQLQKFGRLDDMGYYAVQMVNNDFGWDKIVRTMNETLYKVA